ncbi:glycoside hydrolase family 15 protein [Jatrophihabitans telluris]|uniref:Glycoside hydrolase family 15 protein n=1 Tax=Jatrophihabitans telluris TaxID=2038343 RepID=A0ABY4QVQ0_9ACTN|nr:glycoside hydrolase family 15 protein [Jatrophihabitans telluris]UQX87060.1 glycoside hydrolase family 15 protein [Jatrophihabitans telluris]
MTARLSDMAPHVLREYALIADGERGALCGPHGDLAWLCAPRWDDDAVFSTLVGGAGGYAVTPTERHVWGGSYEPGSLIWRNRWVTDSAVIECRDALAMPAQEHCAVILRRIEASADPARVRVLLDVRARFGQDGMHSLSRDADGTWTGRSGRLRFRWTGAPDAVLDGHGQLALEITVAAGAHHDLVLQISDRDGEPTPRAGELWRETASTWAASVPDFTDSAAPRDARQGYAVLRGLTGSGGGMVAAATMSLPEKAKAGRNYDYRYVWIRDQCYAGLAVAAHGPDRLLSDAVHFVAGALAADGANLKPAYTAGGGRVPDETRLPLPGYPGGADVRGNWVNEQFQLDAPGEALQLFAAAAGHGMIDRDLITAVETAISVIEARWQQPDAGIWELHDDWWTHSRLACVAGLRRAAAVPAFGDGDRLTRLAATITAETSRRCLRADGAWQRSPTKHGVDAALLLPAVRGAFRADDSRTHATLAAVRDQLSVEGYVYRYQQPGRPLGDTEGAFVLCGFITALAEAHQGNHAAAVRLFERNRSASGPPGLLAEEFDINQRQLRGNLPQAFVHALLLETALVLSEKDTR